LQGFGKKNNFHEDGGIHLELLDPVRRNLLSATAL
jgi:hypothetical protein